MISSITSGASALDLATLQRLSSTATSSTNTDETARSGRTGGHRPPGPPPEAIESAAKALDMSESDVRDALAGGSTLEDLATSKGVSKDDLLAAVTDGLAAGAAKHGRQLSADQITEFATHLIDGTQPPPPTGGAAGGADSDLTASGLRGVDTGAGHTRGHHGPPPGTSIEDDNTSTTGASATAGAQRAYQAFTAEQLLASLSTGQLADLAA
ncbi:MAG TPA: hypothetical protein PKY13_01735 [Microthrixaceae bacterium]|nr:hypothetical protein [Microthrixaceae bacterium]